jgi:hypothetical protein
MEKLDFDLELLRITLTKEDEKFNIYYYKFIRIVFEGLNEVMLSESENISSDGFMKMMEILKNVKIVKQKIEKFMKK